MWGRGFAQSPRRRPFFGCPSPEGDVFTKLVQGTFGLVGVEAWLIQGTENMMDHEELKPLGQLPAAPHR